MPLSMKYECYRDCRNGTRGTGGGGQESADCRPAKGSPTSMRDRYASWWPGAHISAPKAPSTYATGSLNRVSQGIGSVWKKKKRVIVVQAYLVQVVGNPKTGMYISYIDEERSRKRKESGNRSDPEKLVSLNYPLLRQSSPPLLRQISRYCGPSRHACAGHTSPELSWNM